MKEPHLSRRAFMAAAAALSSAGLGAAESESGSEHELPGSHGAEPVPSRKARSGRLDPNVFLDPGTEYRGVAFLFLNDKIEPEEAVRQTRAMRRAGWGRVLPRRYAGLLHPSYGKQWNKAVHQIVAAAKKLNMKVFLQEADKNGWYSAAPTDIPGMKDEYRNKCLVRRGADDEPREHETLVARAGDSAYYQRTAYPRSGWEGSFCWLDLLDEDVVRSYLTALFGFLQREFGSEFGRTIEAMWVAEPHLMFGVPGDVPSLPWTTNLPEVFQTQWGYSLLENVPKLFDSTGDFQKVRYHYWRTLGNLLAECYSKVMGEYCRRYNLKFAGHLMGEDTFVSQLQYSVNVMPLLEYMDIPGVDHLTLSLDWPTGDPFIFTPKQASSVANQLGKEKVLAEMYGTSDAGCSFEDRKRVFQWMAVLGINYRNYHGAFYSLRGLRKRFYPPNLNLQQPYWPENRVIADYCARLAYALRQGRYQGNILVLDSIESYYLDGTIERKLAKRVGPLDRDLMTLSHNLLKIQRGFDYGDETLIAKYGRIADGRFVVCQMPYKVVVLPYTRTLRSSTVRLLGDFLDAGGTVLAVGKLPERIDGEVSQRIDRLNSRVVRIANEPEALRTALDRIEPPGIQVTSLNGVPVETIWVHQRTLASGGLSFLTNTSTEATVEAEVLFRGAGRLERWDLETGRVESVCQEKKGEHVRTRLTFAPGGSHLLCLNAEARPINVPHVAPQLVREIPLGTFRVRRDDPNAMTLDFCRFRIEQAWSDLLPVQGVQAILTEQDYHGPVTLRFEFQSEIRPSKCAVVVEQADKHAIQVNGESVTYQGQPFYRDKCFLPVDVTYCVKPGTNHVDVATRFEAADGENIDNEHLDRYYGTELEQVYLIGEFAVKGERLGRDFFETERHRYKPAFVVTKESGVSTGDLLADGYCFFNGTITLTTNAVIPEMRQHEKCYLELGQLDATLAKVKVNGHRAGTIAWRPYRLEITDQVRKGENRIEISLTNSLRNLLGGLHFVPLSNMPGGQWSQKARPRSVNGPQWYRNRGQNKTWSDDYFFRPLGVGSNARITCERHANLL